MSKITFFLIHLQGYINKNTHKLEKNIINNSIL